MKKILVALDGSLRRAGILRTAAKLAADSGAQLVLFRAVALPAEVPADAYLMAPEEFTLSLEKKARDELEVSAREVGVAHIARIHVAIGSPWNAICQAAIEDDVDMIVIGSHGYDTVDRILGTTAAKVVNHADRSVLVVREPARVTAP